MRPIRSRRLTPPSPYGALVSISPIKISPPLSLRVHQAYTIDAAVAPSLWEKSGVARRNTLLLACCVLGTACMRETLRAPEVASIWAATSMDLASVQEMANMRQELSFRKVASVLALR